ncbi:hypothetical protein PHYBLDRAFT_138831 [Phycomyces blakesleeanus NRRL 1555(-)]|uniref:Uncharacterized protein n=1 Tax=Phycomyces blakesleeanus (strain ATCC 8743b / DSM 1359 / FGSC 10004 / NBRC 33097 / NRRL 1555) TaxID=763407 RepID=A0A167RBE3_PHYB8|nr:hypothetical protein PHYBLDRAFT_138831 [Phycomyces blakesleeanus NRRL 1555(-)]OAD81284.1 hypothetical protein PHYBLDRAFT_138831 [Phycomyces blakesleeanus NRRL 1555(-)]|eukprot:XP_018299324.1 hypothetical protein PHYBLDRAFT_138831 [Phycomyces blakesleeanus NRRL 1555(-)]
MTMFLYMINPTSECPDHHKGFHIAQHLSTSASQRNRPQLWHGVLTPSQVSLIYELVNSFSTLVTVTAATTTTIVSAELYLLTTSSGFNLKTFLDSAEVNIDNVKGNEPLPPSAFSLSLDDNTLLRGYQDTIIGQLFLNNMIQKMQFINLLGQVYKGSNGVVRRDSIIQAMFHKNNDHRMSAFTGQIQYLFVSDIINPATYQVDRHTFAYIRWYRTSCQDTRSEQFVEMSKFLFIRSNFQNILPVYHIFMSAAIGVHTTVTGTSFPSLTLSPVFKTFALIMSNSNHTRLSINDINDDHMIRIAPDYKMANSKVTKTFADEEKFTATGTTSPRDVVLTIYFVCDHQGFLKKAKVQEHCKNRLILHM